MSARPKAAPGPGDELAVEVADDVVVERPRRRGRPAESDGLTRERILIAARVCFAESGYAVASTHMVAARVGLTTGALYHHFGSKRDLYAAVFEEVERMLFERFEKVTASRSRFINKLEAILDEILRLSREEPTLTGFLQSATADVGRHADLFQLVQPALNRRDEMFAELVDAGVSTGELAAADRETVLDTVTTVLVGLFAMNIGPPPIQERAVDGYKRLFRGTLVNSKRR
ncbi:MAG TPA: TetR/AcrR family transcriptional regulator [Acidimicrobiia bacterium]|nr:TetR/AcrR family transcriptional regulator [Acidimicrobiia bacterium]